MRPFGIVAQIQALSAVPLAFFAVLLVTGVVIVRGDQDSAAATRTATERLSASDALYDALDAQAQIVTHYQRARKAQEDAAFARQGANLQDVIGALDASVGHDHSDLALYTRYRSDTRSIEALLQKLLGLAGHGNAAVLRRAEENPAAQALSRRWRDDKTAFDETQRRRLLQQYAALNRYLDPIRRLNFGAILLGAIGTLMTVALAGRRIVRRLHLLAENARRFANGEPAEPLDGTDEIAMLNDTMRELTGRLRATARERQQAIADYQRERSIAETLQRALLPADLPTVPGLHVYTAYVAADEASAVGGDWYDVFLLTDGLVGVSMGDVAGHGIQAATRMSAVRQSIRTAARTSDDPNQVLQHVNRMLCAESPAAFVTALFATIDVASGRFRYAVAGHPPPIVIEPGAGAVTLPSGGTVLGIDAGLTFEVYERYLTAASAMVFYTDGLIENERDAIRGTEALLAAAAEEVLRPSRNPADGLQRRVLKEAPRDDSALLFLFFEHFGPSLPTQSTWSFDARDEAAATRVKRAFLRRIADIRPHYDVAPAEMIYGELMSNVVRHTPGWAKVVLDIDESGVALEVCDRGAAFSAGEPLRADEFGESGRGLQLIRSLSGNVSVRRSSAGNCVRVMLPRSFDEAPPARSLSTTLG